MALRVALDTNVLISGLRSRLGASFQLLSRVGEGEFEVALSVALVLEYEEVLLRQRDELGLTELEIGEVLDYLCSVGHHQTVFFLWRPQLKDPADEMVLEVAANAGCDAVVTFNTRDFAGAERFGLEVMTPGAFLARIGAKP